MDVVSEMSRWAEMIRGLPSRPARMECGGLVMDQLSLVASRAIDQPVHAIDYLYGCPVALNDSLPPGEWRMIDAGGNVMHEGRLGDDSQPKD